MRLQQKNIFVAIASCPRVKYPCFTTFFAQSFVSATNFSYCKWESLKPRLEKIFCNIFYFHQSNSFTWLKTNQNKTFSLIAHKTLHFEMEENQHMQPKQKLSDEEKNKLINSLILVSWSREMDQLVKMINVHPYVIFESFWISFF